ncbi:unnamed protein product [Camellia sinensis]
MVWYRRHTRLLVGNPSHLSQSGYQGVGPSLKALVNIIVVGVERSYHLAEDALLRRNGQHALQAIAEIRDLLYEVIQHAYRGDCLHFGHYSVHSAIATPDTSMSSTSVPSTSASATSGPCTSVTPPHAIPYISPDSLHVHPTQHTGISYVADLDWTPPRYMHEDEVYIEGPPRARGRGRGYGRGGRRSRGQGAGRGRGRGQGPAADRDTVAPDKGVSQLTAVSNVEPKGGSEAAQAGEGRSQSQASQVVAGGPHAGEGAPQDLHLRLGKPHIQRVYGKRPRKEVHGRGCGTGGKLGH